MGIYTKLLREENNIDNLLNNFLNEYSNFNSIINESYINESINVKTITNKIKELWDSFKKWAIAKIKDIRTKITNLLKRNKDNKDTNKEDNNNDTNKEEIKFTLYCLNIPDEYKNYLEHGSFVGNTTVYASSKNITKVGEALDKYTSKNENGNLNFDANGYNNEIDSIISNTNEELEKAKSAFKSINIEKKDMMADKNNLKNVLSKEYNAEKMWIDILTDLSKSSHESIIELEKNLDSTIQKFEDAKNNPDMSIMTKIYVADSRILSNDIKNMKQIIEFICTTTTKIDKAFKSNNDIFDKYL